MADLSNFKRKKTVDTCIEGFSVTKTAELIGVPRGTVSKIMTSFEKERKTSPLKHNSGRKRKLADRDRQALMRNVRKGHENTAPKITAELNDHLENPVSLKPISRELHKAVFHGRASIRNNIKVNLFEISRCFHYFAQPCICARACACMCV